MSSCEERVSAPTGEELETLPGAKPALELLDHVIASSGGEQRSGQRKMLAHVAQSFELKRHLLVQAGTGTGKSLGYLIPAVHYAQFSDKPIVVATATLALQTQIINRDLPRLLETLSNVPEGQTDVAVLKGRNNYVCVHKLEGGYPDDEQEDTLFAADVASGSVGRLGQEVLRLRQWAQTTDTGDRDDIKPGVSDRAWRQVSVSAAECLGKRCPLVESCFSELAREKAAQSDIIITNHALLAINAFEGIGVLPEHEVVVIDEAHELADRVTGAVTGSLSAGMVYSAARLVRKHTKASSDPLEHAGSALETSLRGVAAELLPRGLTESIAHSVELVREAARVALSDTKSDSKDSDAPRQLARSALSELLEIAERLLGADEHHEVVWLSRPQLWEAGRGYAPASDDDPATLYIAPLSVAMQLREGLFDGRTVVLTSATLKLGESFDVVAHSLGLSGAGAPRWEGLDVGSPFDYPKQGLLYVAADIAKPSQGISTAQLERMCELVEASNGGALGLFSSRRAAEDAAEYLREHTDVSVLVQGESSLGSLVKEFSEDRDSCLFGTMSLWQGVDVPGDSCRLVLIDRIPFPRPNDPLIQARTRSVASRGGNGFMSVSASYAAVRMAQGVGRLIRSSDDRGVVAVLDSRLATQRYSGYLMSALPPFWKTTRTDVVCGALHRLHVQVS
ncbi:ATP-dependent DNA helicase [Rothia sp. P6271]|uniref:ATP-dependent DNA helicase n=1 Tax=Rothia sp. P6271 TaxID=3402659 RepID=UPI003AD5004F